MNAEPEEIQETAETTEEIHVVIHQGLAEAGHQDDTEEEAAVTQGIMADQKSWKKDCASFVTKKDILSVNALNFTEEEEEAETGMKEEVTTTEVVEIPEATHPVKEPIKEIGAKAHHVHRHEEGSIQDLVPRNEGTPPVTSKEARAISELTKSQEWCKFEDD